MNPFTAKSWIFFMSLLGLWMGETVCICNAQTDAPRSQFQIAGMVVNAMGGSPLALARITIRDVKNPKDVQSVLTGENGHFEFQVKAGKFSLHGAKRGFISGDYDQHERFSTAIVTGAGLATENLILKLAPSAVLNGKVLDESGEPVRHAQVALWQEGHATGVSRIAGFRNERTDDQGFYEFAPLDAGTYFLSVSATPWYAVHPRSAPPEGFPATPVAVDHGLDVVYPMTYYAGATESDDASPIAVRGGDRVEIDLHLTPVPALHMVVRYDPSEANQQGPPRLAKRSFDGIELQRELQNIQIVSPGVFEMVAAPGKYSLRTSGQVKNSDSEVELSQDHQEVDLSSAEGAGNIHVTVRVPGEQTNPNELFLGLREGQRRAGNFQGVSAQGETQFTGIPAGTYDVVAASSRKSYAVVRISSEGHESVGRRLKVNPGETISIALTLAEGSGTVEGSVMRAGKPVAGAMVVLIPKHAGDNSDLFRRDQSDLDGTFAVQDVIPGTYTVVAIAEGWDLDWSKPLVISRYAARGQSVVVPEAGKDSVRLREPVEVQAK